MRLFSATNSSRSSPELVRHSQVTEDNQYPTHFAQFSRQNLGRSPSREKSCADGIGGTTPPRDHSPASIVRGVSTLGRKFSRRFEKFGESETARKLRMASPSRKYQWAIGGYDSGGSTNNLSSNSDNHHPSNSSSSNGSTNANHNNDDPKKRVSRVDSFRNFLSLASSTVSVSTLRTPRAVKRRSRNTDKRQHQQQRNQLVDVGTCTTFETAPRNGTTSLPGGLNSRFGSDLTLLETQSDVALSECQSEVDLRYYYPTTEDEDDRSVVSDGFHRKPHAVSHASRSASNLMGSNAARLGILPENRTINFQEAGIVYNSSNGMQIKSYGMIDGKSDPSKNSLGPPGVYSKGSANSGSIVNESGYSSDYASGTNSTSSRASPRGSLDEEHPQEKTVLSSSSSSDDSRSLTPPLKEREERSRLEKQLKCPTVPPKKPIRVSKMASTKRSHSSDDKHQMSPESQPSDSLPSTNSSNLSSATQTRMTKDYKMIRLVKHPNSELGIIIAKKKLKDLQTTGFHIVHIEPDGLIDR